MIAAFKPDLPLIYGTHVVILRPSLRAAMYLEDLHGGWGNLFRRVEEFDTATIQAVIRAAASDRSAAEALLSSMAHLPLSATQKALCGPLSEFLSLFFAELGSDEPASSTRPPGPAVPWSQAYVQLYEIGTGWLGWTPAETWAASPAEITAALRGHVRKLEAMNGTADQAAPGQTTPKQTEAQRQANIEAGLDPDFDRAGLRALKARM